MKQIPIRNRRGVVLAHARVDDDTYPELSRYKWSFGPKGYVHRGAGKTTARMHREVLDAPAGTIVDHIDGDKLNNTRENLRLVTPRQSSWNTGPRTTRTSRYKGVSRYRDGVRWVAQARVGGRNTHIGIFDTEDAAALAYNQAVAPVHGAYARPNAVP